MNTKPPKTWLILGVGFCLGWSLAMPLTAAEKESGDETKVAEAGET